MKITKPKKILIPHIFYEVELKDLSKAPQEIKDHNYFACVQKKRFKSIIWCTLPINEKNIPTLAHEIVHVLQNICFDYSIDFVTEQEHTAYMYQFIFNSLIGYKYEIPK